MGLHITVTHLPCLQGEGVQGGDPSDEEEANGPELLEEVEVSCTLDHLVRGTYSLTEIHTVIRENVSVLS